VNGGGEAAGDRPRYHAIMPAPAIIFRTFGSYSVSSCRHAGDGADDPSARHGLAYNSRRLFSNNFLR
jgi:hypothetical protein